MSVSVSKLYRRSLYDEFLIVSIMFTSTNFTIIDK